VTQCPRRPTTARFFRVIRMAQLRAPWIAICRGLEEREMNAIRIMALALIIAGALGLAYGGFSYTKENHEAKIGPIELNVKEKQTVNIPMWAGIGAIVIGGALLMRRD
jgi:TRAP-type C4-dicarboxylate transport system permease small subunit